ncbi:hypothetical protein ONS95_000403 [Cadophora gregata]|uniref:uncharacterized protein n=1 Tax=Cadophora gregata TaxID=51156 RepID=UPI0026DB66F9|nr:uncharacterized protein ONS95_000403 [Cadophora gregata]KAK0128430.1 hypothetical protein ONS95_000403 [Cadophora gregata]
MAARPPPYLKLPNELWDIIFSYGFVRKDFLMLSTINKAFNRAVEPSLYSSFTWVPKPSVGMPFLSNLRNHNIRSLTRSKRKRRTELPTGYFVQQPPYLLLRSILEQPRRAGYLKKVKLLSPSPDYGLFWDTYQARECGFSDEYFEACKKSIELLPSAQQSYWIDGLYKGRLDVIVGLLLLRLSGLTHIDIRLRDTSVIGSTVFEALRLPSVTGPNYYRYPNVQCVMFSVDRADHLPQRTVHQHHIEDIFDAYQPVPDILKFQKLESLSLTFCSPGTFWQGKFAVALNLRKLSLRHGHINEHILQTFLAATPLLEELDCELVYDDGVQQYLDCNVLKSALSLVSKSLKRLVIDITTIFGNDWNPIPWNIQNYMGSLKAFEQLRYLDIPLILYTTEIWEASQAASLVSFDDRQVDYWSDRMPDSLEWFGIRASGPNGSTYQQQYEAERCAEVYLRLNPAVKKIVRVFDMDDSDDEDWPEVI